MKDKKVPKSHTSSLLQLVSEANPEKPVGGPVVRLGKPKKVKK